MLKRWRATPLPPAGYLASRIAASVLVAAASGAVTVAAGVAFLGAQIDVSAALTLALTFVLGALAWASIGTAASAFIPGVDAAWPVLGVTYLPVLALSGAFGAITEPGWLAALVSYLPAQPLVHAAARALSGSAPSAHDVIVPVAWTAAAFAVARRAFRWEP